MTSHRARGRAEMGRKRSSSWCLGNRIFGIVDMDIALKRLSPALEKNMPYFQPEPPRPIPRRSEMSGPEYHKAMLDEFWKYVRQAGDLLKERSAVMGNVPAREAVGFVNQVLTEYDRLELQYRPFIRYGMHHRKRLPNKLTAVDVSERLPVSKIDREYVIKKYNYQCAYCGKTGDETAGPDGASWHIDHIIPHSWGGEHDRNNFALSCRSCNLSKSNRWWHPSPPITSAQKVTGSVCGGH